MAVIKCKMCGGDLNLIEGASTAECEYCGSVQTVPKVDDEKKLNLFARANRLRAACEFDKASGIYESIVADFPEEAEAYWGLILCKYGIEYVDDPATGKKIPTCHRSSFDSIMDDTDFEQVLENADPTARRVYRDEAKSIEELRKDIIAVSANEEPYDIFICYKETAEDGQRTLDSVLAQDVYDALTEKDYRVFFSRITLEDKLGVEYEPYIFAALNSARIMLAFGTDYEYFNAVWVKNEWSRFLKLMAADKKKYLIPCYKGIDAYDMPKEFAKLQAQDLGKVGAIQDLLRGIEKLLPKAAPQPQQVVYQPQQMVYQQASASNVAPLLQRMYLFLEDRKWNDADDYAEKVLDQDPKNAEAYLGKLLANQRATCKQELGERTVTFLDDPNYEKIVRFGSEELHKEMVDYLKQVEENIQEEEYNDLMSRLEKAEYPVDFWSLYEAFTDLAPYRDSAEKAAHCEQRANQVSYENACEYMDSAKSPKGFMFARKMFENLADYADSREKAEYCLQQAKKFDYDAACEALEAAMTQPDFQKAADLFEALEDFQDSREKTSFCRETAQTLEETAMSCWRNFIPVQVQLMPLREDLEQKLQDKSGLETSMREKIEAINSLPAWKNEYNALAQQTAGLNEDLSNRRVLAVISGNKLLRDDIKTLSEFVKKNEKRMNELLYLINNTDEEKFPWQIENLRKAIAQMQATCDEQQVKIDQIIQENQALLQPLCDKKIIATLGKNPGIREQLMKLSQIAELVQSSEELQKFLK